jgi:hypothetical protein
MNSASAAVWAVVVAGAAGGRGMLHSAVAARMVLLYVPPSCFAIARDWVLS